MLRTRPCTAIAAVALLLAPALIAQKIAYQRYTLANGMTVILHQDHSVPVAAVNLWYRVGARDEAPGRSGFAHLFEHLMFMGTERVPGGQFDTIMEAGGGSNNASTNLDRTNYFSSGPASLLPTLLWLDADRLEDLGRAMDQSKLDRQRDIVRNEIRQQVENQPYGKAEELVFRLMYPAGHPYHEAVYGTHADLEAACLTDVKDFFGTFYVPRNASLVVAGDFDPERIRPLIAELFGTIPGGAPVDHRTAPPARLERTVRTTVMDKVQLAMVKMVWHSPAAFADGDAEMDLLAALLSQGRNSRLYRALVVEQKLAADVSAHQDGASLGSLFVVEAQAAAGTDLERLEQALDAELQRLRDQEVAAAELDERKALVELGRLAALQSVETVADKLNAYQHAWGEPDSFQRDLDRYRAATPARLRALAQQVLTPTGRAVVRVLPEQPERGASPRSKRPEDLPIGAFTPPAPVVFTLANGIPVQLWTRPKLPLVAVTALFASPGPQDAPGQAGRTGLAAQMTEEGAGERDAAQFAAALQALGANYSASAEVESTTASMTALRRNFPGAMALMADALRRPRLAAADWERVQRLRLDELRQDADDPTTVAGRVGLRTLFGDDHPYAWPTAGTVASVGALTLEQIRAAHRTVFDPRHVTLLVAGDVTEADARAVLQTALGDWHGDATVTARPPLRPAPVHERLRVVLVDRPDAVQTVIRFALPAPVYATPERVELELLNCLLGGGFTSRLNQNLREAHGYAYGAGSRYALHPAAGSFTASASVKAEVTGAALAEFLAEFQRLRAGDVKPEEAQKASATLRTEAVQACQGLHGLLQLAGERVANGVSFASLAADLQRMPGVDATTLNARAKAALPLEQGVLVLVGDKRRITEQLKGLDLAAPVEVSAEGEPRR